MVTLDQGGWVRDDAYLEAPPNALHDLVAHTFVLDVRHARQLSWMILPDYSAHVLVHLAGRSDSPRVGPCSIVGPRTVPIEVDVADRLWTIGARLRPGALPALTGLPASDMVDVGAARAPSGAPRVTVSTAACRPSPTHARGVRAADSFNTPVGPGGILGRP
jgi:hypothetical protein